MSQKLYIYTKRRARINNKSQYVGLIPKLFSDNYNTSNYASKSNLMEKYSATSNSDLFLKMLNDPTNELQKAFYISPNDKQKIIDMNYELFNQMPNENFENLLTHLYRSHNMQYGLYFSFLYAYDDIDFMSKFNRSIKPLSEDRIILYTTFDNLLQEIQKINNEKNFDSMTEILYVNNGWQYGEITNTSIKLKKNTDNSLDINKFKLDVISALPQHKRVISNPELICQIPLRTELFKFFYVNEQHGSSNKLEKSLTKTKKYLKYKLVSKFY